MRTTEYPSPTSCLHLPTSDLHLIEVVRRFMKLLESILEADGALCHRTQRSSKSRCSSSGGVTSRGVRAAGGKRWAMYSPRRFRSIARTSEAAGPQLFMALQKEAKSGKVAAAPEPQMPRRSM